jgi:hypothetical protein
LREQRDAGYGMVALLLVVLILGILVAIVIGGGLSTPSNVEVATANNAPAACQSDYATVDAAVQSYFAANIVEPPAGTAWATSHHRGGPYLVAWPSDPKYYVLSWNGARLEVQPVHGIPSYGSPGAAATHSGCFGIASSGSR